MGEDDYNKDDEMPELSEIGDIGEILLLVRFPLQVNERKVSEVSSQDVVFVDAASGVSCNKIFPMYLDLYYTILTNAWRKSTR